MLFHTRLVANRNHRFIFSTDTLLFFGDHVTVDEGPSVKYVWIEPTPHLLNTEIRDLADSAKVSPVTIPGYWLDKPDTDTAIGAAPRPGEKVVLSLHGGGYVRGSASPRSVFTSIARALLEQCASIHRVLALEYRLSKHAPDAPAHPFPAALLDALAAYVYLTDVVRFAPEDIVVVGDSAGGNLALALVRYLVENRDRDAGGGVPGLPAPPAALVLL